MCFSFSNAPALSAISDPQLSGLAATLSGYLLPVYIATVEEVAFRGQLQARLADSFGKLGAMVFATAVFLAMHAPNNEFVNYWPLYLAISTVCGVLALDRRYLLYAVLVHAAVNLFGTVLAPSFNRATDDLESSAGRATLLALLVLATVIYIVSVLVLRKRTCPEA